MKATKENDSRLWDVCSDNAHCICIDAKKNERDINTTIYAFKILIPPNLFDVDNWEDVENYITLAIFNLSLFYLRKNLPVLLRANYQA